MYKVLAIAALAGVAVAQCGVGQNNRCVYGEEGVKIDANAIVIGSVTSNGIIKNEGTVFGAVQSYKSSGPAVIGVRGAVFGDSIFTLTGGQIRFDGAATVNGEAGTCSDGQGTTQICGTTAIAPTDDTDANPLSSLLPSGFSFDLYGNLPRQEKGANFQIGPGASGLYGSMNWRNFDVAQDATVQLNGNSVFSDPYTIYHFYSLDFDTDSALQLGPGVNTVIIYVETDASFSKGFRLLKSNGEPLNPLVDSQRVVLFARGNIKFREQRPTAQPVGITLVAFGSIRLETHTSIIGGVISFGAIVHLSEGVKVACGTANPDGSATTPADPTVPADAPECVPWKCVDGRLEGPPRSCSSGGVTITCGFSQRCGVTDGGAPECTEGCSGEGEPACGNGDCCDGLCYNEASHTCSAHKSGANRPRGRSGRRRRPTTVPPAAFMRDEE